MGLIKGYYILTHFSYLHSREWNEKSEFSLALYILCFMVYDFKMCTDLRLQSFLVSLDISLKLSSFIHAQYCDNYNFLM